MNIYVRYFNREILAQDIDTLVDFLSTISDIRITEELVDDIQNYVNSDITYPKRYKIRPRVYFILIKTEANSIEEFKANKKQANNIPANEAQSKKDIRTNILSEVNPGWYKGILNFKRVIQDPETGKFRYEDTTFSALVKAESGLECYNQIILHLKDRKDVDMRSQFPSAKGNNFEFKRISDI